MTREERLAVKAPLSGIRVIEVGNFISAPSCAMILGELGAEVVKLETPRVGDDSRYYGPFQNDEPDREKSGLFLYLNRNKFGATLNLDTGTGRDLLSDLVGISDILIENIPDLPDGQPQLEYGDLGIVNPQLVMLSISPFGKTGPRRQWKAEDINIAAASGFSASMGLPEREPLGFPVPMAGFNAGLYAAAAVLTALCVRDLHGEGQAIDVSEVEALATLHTGEEVLMWMHQWRETRRMGHRTLTTYGFPSCNLGCKDGQVFVNTTGQDNWLTLIELMGNPDWTREPRFRDLMKIDESDWPEGDRHLGAWLANYTRDELLDLEIGRNLRVGIAPVRDIGEVSRDPSLDGFFTGIPGDDGQAVRFPGLAYHFSNWAPPLSRRAPGLGEDNVLVFCELLGVPRHELVRMYQAGVV